MSKELPFGLNGYSLSEATDDEYEFVMDCVKGSILSSVPEEDKLLSDLWINDILNISEASINRKEMDCEVFILKSQTEKIGMLWMGVSKDQFTCDPTGYLLGVFIIESQRGKGLGRELMRSAEHWCKMKGLITLTLNVGSENKAASNLYSSSGFIPQTVVMKKMLL